VQINCRSVSDEGIPGEAQAPVILLDIAALAAFYVLLTDNNFVHPGIKNT